MADPRDETTVPDAGIDRLLRYKIEIVLHGKTLTLWSKEPNLPLIKEAFRLLTIWAHVGRCQMMDTRDSDANVFSTENFESANAAGRWKRDV